MPIRISATHCVFYSCAAGFFISLGTVAMLGYLTLIVVVDNHSDKGRWAGPEVIAYPFLMLSCLAFDIALDLNRNLINRITFCNMWRNEWQRKVVLLGIESVLGIVYHSAVHSDEALLCEPTDTTCHLLKDVCPFGLLILLYMCAAFPQCRPNLKCIRPYVSLAGSSQTESLLQAADKAVGDAPIEKEVVEPLDGPYRKMGITHHSFSGLFGPDHEQCHCFV